MIREALVDLLVAAGPSGRGARRRGLAAPAVLARLGAGAALLLAAPSALGQRIQPAPPPAHATIPEGLQACTAEALNVSGFVGSDGSIVVYNVPSSQGSVRVRATCSDALGNTVSGQSAPVTPVPGGTSLFGHLDFGAAVPIAARLTLSPTSARLVGLGSTRQLAVGAVFADLSTGDVTVAAAGTTYRTSNPGVATVSADGLVTAVGPGSAILQALNDGAGGLSTITVLPAALQSLAVTPASLGVALSPIFPAQPARLRVTGVLTGGGAVDLTAASSGTTYTSSNPAVAVVSADGAVAGVSAGSAVITVADGSGSASTQVSVLVSAGSPAPSGACATPGFAYNVDVDGALAFVADGQSGLLILEASSCVSLGQLAFAGEEAVDVRVQGSLAAVALGPGGFALVDVSDPSLPVVRSRTAGAVVDLWLSGDRLYTASSNGLAIYDVSLPDAPALLGSQALGGPATAVAADSARGLVVVLTAEPALAVLQTGGPAPWPVVTVPLPAATNQADDVVLLGTSAYVANGRAGIHEVDVTNPPSPSLKASSTLDFDARGVAVQRTAQGTFVAAADDRFFNAVPLFDTRLANTFNVDFSSFPGDILPDANSNGVALGDGFGVVTVGGAGIQVFRTRQLVDNAGVPPVVSITSPMDGSSLVNGFGVVAATATDDVGVASVELYANGVLVATALSRPYKAFFLSPVAGPTTLMARAFDFGGNHADSLPVQVSATVAGECLAEIGAGWYHSCARKADRSVWCWGFNADGELGDGTTASPKASPVQVTGLGTAAVELAVGISHTCARKADGSVWCWGFDDFGQIVGGGTDPITPSPVQVTALGTSAVEITAGYYQTCARKADGSVWCWGGNDDGELGDGTTVTPSSPVQVTALGTSAVEITAGVYQTCARKADGSVWCWGNNDYGQVGDGTTVSPRPLPVQVAALGTSVVEIAAGYFHTCARKADGSVWCWGSNFYGQMGNGTVTKSEPVPVQVTALGTSAVEIATGYFHSCARKADGTVWCWGYDGDGEIGDGTTAFRRPSPTQVSALGTTAVAITAGGGHSCARTPDGSAWCWGADQYGQMGDGTTGSPRPSPVHVALTCP
jgi:alpha-tubulin suppressor-like RCC1 family protein